MGMADDTRAGMTGPARHVYGPRPLGAVVPAVTRGVFSKHKPALGQLLSDWPLIVGPALAATTTPRRLSAGTLTLGCAGPIALELQHLSTQLIDRINTTVGRKLVERLRFIPQLPEAAPLPPPPPTPAETAAARKAAARKIEDFPPGPLRDALLGLGTAVHRRRRGALPHRSASRLDPAGA
jgi:hypothetical protein